MPCPSNDLWPKKFFILFCKAPLPLTLYVCGLSFFGLVTILFCDFTMRHGCAKMERQLGAYKRLYVNGAILHAGANDVRFTCNTIHVFLFVTGSARCFFSAEYQGTFILQMGRSLTNVVIDADEIKIWGMCHRKMGRNVILVQRSNDMDCYRCMRIQVRSPNVLQLHTRELDKCYTRENRARRTCPQDHEIYHRQSKELILLREF